MKAIPTIIATVATFAVCVFFRWFSGTDIEDMLVRSTDNSMVLSLNLITSIAIGVGVGQIINVMRKDCK